MSRFNQLETFVHVVESGSFSGAAERLQVAKSVVSRRLTELEERLGARLLNRTTRRLSLTEGGQQFYQRAARFLQEMEEAEQALTAGTDALQGRVRVAAPLSFGILHLAPAVDDFLAAHPGVELDLDLNDRWANLVEEGFDMAVRIGQLPDSSLVARRLASIRLVAVASAEYLERHGEPRGPEDLSLHHGLIYANEPDPHTWLFQDSQGNQRKGRIGTRLRANNGDVLLSAAIRGLGIVVLPTFLAYRAIETGQVRPILTEFAPATSAAYAVFPSNRYVPARVRAFVEALTARFGDNPYWDRCLSGSR